MNKAIFILLVALAVHASATTVRDCDINPEDDNESVTISGCDASPCTFKKGRLVEFNVKFNSGYTGFGGNTTTVYITENVDYTFDGITAPVPGIDGQSICGKIHTTADGLPADCPLEMGVYYTLTEIIEVPLTAPSARGTIRAALLYGFKFVSCFKFDVIISD